MEKPKLGLVNINPFEKDGKWYFELTYNVENKDGDVVQIIYPSVRSPFTEKRPTEICYSHPPRLVSECESRHTLKLTGSEAALCSFVSNTISVHQPFINKPCISAGVCEHDKMQILDKIREQVEFEKLGYPPSSDYYKAIMRCLQIIDKYRAEGGYKE